MESAADCAKVRLTVSCRKPQFCGMLRQSLLKTATAVNLYFKEFRLWQKKEIIMRS